MIENNAEDTIIASRKNEDLIATVKDHLLGMYQLPADKVNNLLDISKKSLKKQVENAEKAILQGDIELLIITVHAMTGGLLNLGLKEWADITREIEYTAKSGEGTETLAVQIKKLRAGLEPLFQFHSNSLSS